MLNKLRALIDYKGEVLRYLALSPSSLTTFNSLIDRRREGMVDDGIDSMVLRGLHDSLLDESIKLSRLLGHDPRKAALEHAMSVFTRYKVRMGIKEVPQAFLMVLDQISFGLVDIPEPWATRVRQCKTKG